MVSGFYRLVLKFWISFSSVSVPAALKYHSVNVEFERETEVKVFKVPGVTLSQAVPCFRYRCDVEYDTTETRILTKGKDLIKNFIYALVLVAC